MLTRAQLRIDRSSPLIRWLNYAAVQFALATVVVVTAPAQGDPDTSLRRMNQVLPTGRRIDRIVSRADTTQQYALYLPAAYTRDRRWPVLFLLDPRGRALLPLSRFQVPAERLGYIVISSYNTLSDGPSEPNHLATNAMLEDVQRWLSVDPRRFYLVGFSGTARFAWEKTQSLLGSPAGIFGAGAATPGRGWIHANLGRKAPALFGAVGTLDPNYEEVRAFDEELDSIGTPHHIERFDGGHEWPPGDVCERAVAWFDLQAMRRGLKPLNQTWIDSVFRDWSAAAHQVEARHDVAGAMRRYRLLRSDFDGLTDISELLEPLRRLEADPTVRRIIRTEDATAKLDERRGEALAAFIVELKRGSTSPSLAQAHRRLDLGALAREANRSDDSINTIAAQRALERIFVFMSFYVPREMFAAGQFGRAALALRIARVIKPTDGIACFWLARALSQTGERDDALSALECAAASGRVRAVDMETEALLEPLRAEPRYQATVRRLKGTG